MSRAGDLIRMDVVPHEASLFCGWISGMVPVMVKGVAQAHVSISDRGGIWNVPCRAEAQIQPSTFLDT